MLHRFVSERPDGPDAGKIQPSHWNTTHAWYPLVNDDSIEVVTVILDWQFPDDWDGVPPDLYTETGLATIFGIDTIASCVISGGALWLQRGDRAVWVGGGDGLHFQKPTVAGASITWTDINSDDVEDPLRLGGARLRLVIYGSYEADVDPWAV